MEGNSSGIRSDLLPGSRIEGKRKKGKRKKGKQKNGKLKCSRKKRKWKIGKLAYLMLSVRQTRHCPDS